MQAPLLSALMYSVAEMSFLLGGPYSIQFSLLWTGGL